MTEIQAETGEPIGNSRHPIHLVVTDDLERNRLTVLFRLFLALPHFIWAAIWGFGAYFVVIVAWFIALFMGRVPDGIHNFLAGYVRYQAHVYAYFSLAANPFPAFMPAAGYPVDFEIAPAAKQNRLVTFFRFLLVIPAIIVLYVLQLVAYVVMVLGWFYSLVTGKMAKGMRDLLAYWIRYQSQTIGYILLVTSRYPSFSDD